MSLALGISVGSFSLDCWVFWLLLLLCITFLWWFGIPKNVDLDVTQLFLCAPAVAFNFVVVVLGLLNRFAGRGGESAMEKVGLITTCRENKSSSSDIPGNSHLGCC